jgi:hypothetical protein
MEKNTSFLNAYLNYIHCTFQLYIGNLILTADYDFYLSLKLQQNERRAATNSKEIAARQLVTFLLLCMHMNHTTLSITDQHSQ